MKDIFRCPSGWLALGNVNDGAIRIGVTAPTREDAEAKLIASLKAWRRGLELVASESSEVAPA